MNYLESSRWSPIRPANKSTVRLPVTPKEYATFDPAVVTSREILEVFSLFGTRLL
jgi:hypothetical protein